jgi:site-specific DNA recombinase
MRVCIIASPLFCEAQRHAQGKSEAAPSVRPRLHPNLSLLYKDKITNLIEALNAPETIAEATGAMRQLIEEVRLVPKRGSLQVELHGELAALLKLSEEPKTKHPLTETEGVQVTMVAGAGFEPTTFGL